MQGRTGAFKFILLQHFMPFWGLSPEHIVTCRTSRNWGDGLQVSWQWLAFANQGLFYIFILFLFF